MGGGGGSKSVTVGYRYYMSLFMGLCRGPIDEMCEIKVGDKQCWTGSLKGSGGMFIDQQNLFGGDEAEGGIWGAFTLFMGDDGQVLTPPVQGTTGLLGARGVATAFFDGEICAINPYPKPWKFRLRRALAGWDGPVWQPSLAVIPLAGGKIQAMNPAHILYECITNRKWGRGLARDWIDEIAFAKVATQLVKEEFGLCIRWTRSTELGQFVQTILNHIGGALYIDRQTGLVTLSLIRQDYDPDALPIFDRSSGLLEIVEDETAAPGSAINEMIVTFMDPQLDDQRQVRAQNLASIQTLGYKNTATQAYEGVPTVEMAGRLALRDLRAQTTTLRRYKIVCDRRAWKVPPGGVFKISAPERGISQLVLRAGDIRDTTLKDGRITISAVIDVFGMPASSYVAQIDSTWTPPNGAAGAIETRKVEEANSRELIREGVALSSVDRTDGAIKVCAKKPSALALSYKTYGRVGAQTYDSNNELFTPFTPYGELSAGITFDAATLTVSPASMAATDMTIANYQAIQIDDEVMQLTAWDPATGVASVKRGCVDTIPAAHGLGAAVWFIDVESGTDGEVYQSSETVDVKLLTKATAGVANLVDMPVNTVTIYGRQGRPWPPAGVRANNGAATPTNYYPQQGTIPVFTSSLVRFAWQTRNRILAQDMLIGAAEAAQVGETNQKTRVEIADAATPGTIKRSVDIANNVNVYDYTVALQNADFTIASGATKRIIVKVYAFDYDGTNFRQQWFPVQTFTIDLKR